jgi:hypothetical protein
MVLQRHEQNTVRILQRRSTSDACNYGGQMAGLAVQLHNLSLPRAVRIALLERRIYAVGRVAGIREEHECRSLRSRRRNPAGIVNRIGRAVLVVIERQRKDADAL